MAYINTPTANGSLVLNTAQESKTASEAEVEFLEIPAGKTFTITGLLVTGASATGNTVSFLDGAGATEKLTIGYNASSGAQIVFTGTETVTLTGKVKLKFGKLVEAKAYLLVKGILR